LRELREEEQGEGGHHTTEKTRREVSGGYPSLPTPKAVTLIKKKI
jgi:hypothetical protein